MIQNGYSSLRGPYFDLDEFQRQHLPEPKKVQLLHASLQKMAFECDFPLEEKGMKIF